MGISKEDLAKFGIKYNKDNSVTDDTKPLLLEALRKLVSSRFGGMDAKMSETYEGKMSTLSGAVFNAFADGFAKALPYAKGVLDSMTAMFEGIGAQLAAIDWAGFGGQVSALVKDASSALASIDWQGMGQTALDYAAEVAEVFGMLFSPEGRTELAGVINAAWDRLRTDVFPAVVESLWDIGHAVVIDLADSLAMGAEWLSLKIREGLSEGQSGFMQGVAAAFYHPIEMLAGLAVSFEFAIAKVIFQGIGWIAKSFVGIAQMFAQVVRSALDAVGLGGYVASSEEIDARGASLTGGMDKFFGEEHLARLKKSLFKARGLDSEGTSWQKLSLAQATSLQNDKTNFELYRGRSGMQTDDAVVEAIAKLRGVGKTFGSETRSDLTWAKGEAERVRIDNAATAARAPQADRMLERIAEILSRIEKGGGAGLNEFAIN
jgi:hypothetical protein